MDIVFSSATQLAQAIRAKRVSSLEVLDAHLAQIETYNRDLNAIVAVYAEEARARALAADEALARGESWGPLHGVPFTLKDCHATAGLRTTCGFPPLAEYVPQQDSTVTSRLKGAGGILMGKTNAAQLLGDFQTRNPIFGLTSNPWDSQRTPGGSSGGATAALAAGMTSFDIGTDLSGSIRLPAHFCGVYGLKPTEKRVSLSGIVAGPSDVPRAIRMMSSVGPLARTIEDLSLLYALIAGPDGRDTEVQPVPIDPVPNLTLEGLRIAVAPAIAGLPVAAKLSAALQAVARQLSASGAIVEEAALPELDLAEVMPRLGALVGMLVGAFDGSRDPATLAQYLEAQHHRDRAIVAWEAFFQDWDALLCPVSMVNAFPHCEPGEPLRVDGRMESYWAVSAYSALFNYTGHPAVALPCGLDQDGLPLGVQLVAKRWEDSRLLGIARAVCQVSGGFRRPPAF